ncbi:uncharacterized protein [Drosophila virilis]|uniref:Uncharacterized protein n=1 Tax=Drosophila virilis TaxID=7244 RepID=A0A0Q9W9I2_DROVI|nr:uncharacterized protein Dvir_GJ25755 [Drosophila virilis]
MAQVQQIQIVQHCECYHRRRLIGATLGWLWGPCRRCRLIMNGNVVLVPTTGVVTVSPGKTSMRVTPAVVSSNTQYMAMPQQVVDPPPAYAPPEQTASNWQVTKQSNLSDPPPKYSEKC